MSNFKIFNLKQKNSHNLPEFIQLCDLPKNQTILLISPHSDDIAVSCGGAIHLLSRNNQIIPLLYFTGHRGVENAKPKIGTKIREKEMQKESALLGIQKPCFLHLSSYEKNDRITLRQDTRKIKKFLLKYKPDLIFLPALEDLQPRHSLAAKMTLQAIKQLPSSLGQKIKFFFYETPWSPFSNLDFNTVFVLSKNNFKTKLKAVLTHRSQIKRTPFDKIVKSLNTLHASVIPEQRIGGYGSHIKNLGKYLEVFKTADFK